MLTGIVWTAWHVPILLFADYNSGTPWWFSLPCFTVMVAALSIMLTWLRRRSNSVWPCAILNVSHNLFVQGFFTPLTGARGSLTDLDREISPEGVTALGLRLLSPPRKGDSMTHVGHTHCMT
ncbi:MAG: hypothetical protein JWM63_5368 [Gammaproteobacteria bacterium]|jgi:membrane protease YdiL (CAAX protease family)|nr:hypothetical protein [Gammaproteobacteria bacterium]